MDVSEATVESWMEGLQRAMQRVPILKISETWMKVAAFSKHFKRKGSQKGEKTKGGK